MTADKNKFYDLVAIGGGTAGLVATLGVAGIGGRAALVEAHRTGGDCLWTGCVPSKALLSAGAAAHAMRTAGSFGISPVEPEVDFGQVMDSVRRAQEVIEPHDSPERLRSNGVDVVAGHGRFVGPGAIEIAGRRIGFRTALISTGSKPSIPPIDGLSGVNPLTSDTVWGMDSLPSRLLVLGGGPIGCELGQAFARLGSSVTIVESLSTLLPREVARVGLSLASALESEGVDVRTGVRVEAVQSSANGGEARLSDGSTLSFDRVLVAVGRKANTDDLGLASVGVEVAASGHVVVDDTMATTGDRIFAAGDVTGLLPFTHVAANQARLVVTNAMFRTRRRFDASTIPWVTFTDPEVARVGIDAFEANDRWGSKAVVQDFEYAKLDRAITSGGSPGWVELVADPKRRLVGATIVGPAAGESIAELTAWIRNEGRIDDLSMTVHAYPTFSEGPSRAADEVMRAKYFAPRLTKASAAALSVLRRFDRPR